MSTACLDYSLANFERPYYLNIGECDHALPYLASSSSYLAI